MATAAGTPAHGPPHAFFSHDYAAARSRFRAAAAACGARLHALPLVARGPRGEALTIDIACLGDESARRVLLHSAGIHGVEAYAGSAIQLALLADPPPLRPGIGAVLVHVLNPYGMAWLRRTNENNVDLNRNFLGPHDAWSGAPPLYSALDGLLNPPTPPVRDAFVLRALMRVARHGYPAVKQAVAQGQYEYPRGLFYGGARLEEGPRRYLEWLARHLDRAAAVLAIDVHTGLGPRGEDTLLVEPGYRAPPRLAAALGRPLIDAASGHATSYVVKGALASGVRRALPHAQLHGMVQEFGTRPVLRVISALRDENRWHFHGGGTLDHPAKRALRATLCPDDAAWRAAVVARGTAAARAGLEWLTTGAGDDM